MNTSQTPAIIEAKQSRSLATQGKLLEALYRCLQSKVYEQISIKEIADEAGVSVGTFYRRFKDKESLLPILYASFGEDLIAWLEDLEARHYTDLSNVVQHMVANTYQFFVAQQPVFRTLHLNARLQPALLDGKTLLERKEVYARMANILLRFKNEIRADDPELTTQNVVFLLVSGLLEKSLYPTLTPAVATSLTGEQFAEALPKMLLSILILPSQN